MIPVLGRELELCASEVLGGEGGPASELFALKDEVQVSC